MPDLHLTEGEFAWLLIALGYAAGRAAAENDQNLAIDFLRVANTVNKNNPDWTPYEVENEKG